VWPDFSRRYDNGDDDKDVFVVELQQQQLERVEERPLASIIIVIDIRS